MAENKCCETKTKKMNNECCCSGQDNVVLVCSGGSNVGQITNEVAKELDEKGIAKFTCLAGIGGNVSGMIESVKAVEKVIVIDGCPVCCGRKCMELAGITNFEHIVVTEHGITKKHEFSISSEDKNKIMNIVLQKINTTRK